MVGLEHVGDEAEVGEDVGQRVVNLVGHPGSEVPAEAMRSETRSRASSSRQSVTSR